jgi:hypothetical protein
LLKNPGKPILNFMALLQIAACEDDRKDHLDIDTWGSKNGPKVIFPHSTRHGPGNGASKSQRVFCAVNEKYLYDKKTIILY